MIIESINIKNFRSIGLDPGIKIQCGALTVLAGENDSGKTAVLLAILGGLEALFSQERLSPWLKDAILPRGNRHASELYESSSAHTEVTFTLKLNDEEIDEVFSTSVFPERYPNKMDVARKCLKQARSILSVQFSDAPHVEFPPVAPQHNIVALANEHNLTGDMTAILTVPFTHERVASTFQETHGLLYVPAFRSYNPHAFAGNALPENDEPIVFSANDPSQLINFIRQINTERATREGLYKKFIRYVQIMFPTLTSIYVSRPDGSRHDDIFVTWKRRTEHPEPLGRSGSGVVNALFVAAKAITSNDELIGIVDEPETSLHPKMQTRLMRFMRVLSREERVRWVIATHSPFIMNRAGESDSLIQVSHNGVSTQVREIIPENRLDFYTKLGAVLPQALGATAVVWVEGPTEARILPELMRSAGNDPDKYGITFISLGGDNIYKTEVSDLPRIVKDSMIVIDSDLKCAVSDGGSVKAEKQNLRERCKDADVEFFMTEDYREIENMYPAHYVHQVTGHNEPFDSYTDMKTIIPDNRKVEIGLKVAESMTAQEAAEFPTVAAIRAWLKRIEIIEN